MKKISFILCCLHLLLYGLTMLNAASFESIISGVITDNQTGEPLFDVHIEIIENGAGTWSDSAGKYRFDSVSAGSYTLLFSKGGYERYERSDIYCTGQGHLRIDVGLTPRIYTLDSMVVKSTSFHRSADMAASTKVMHADELLHAPGSLNDIQRVVQNNPSVSSGGDNINEVVVRGGSAGENLMVVDEIDIPNPNHFADVKSGGGVISLLNPLLVKGVIFNAGVPPAQYGGKASSVIDVKLREGNDSMIIGGIDLGVAGVGGHCEGPIGNRANFMVSGQKSYLDFITRFDPHVALPKYWGLQSKVAGRSDDGTLLSFNGIFGRSEILIQELAKQHLEYDNIYSAGVVYAAGASVRKRWDELMSSLIVISGTGNTFDRCTDIADTSQTAVRMSRPGYQRMARDTFFFGGSWVDEQTVKVQQSFDFDRNRCLVGSQLRRHRFFINQWSRPDTLKDFTTDSINGTVVIDSVTKLPKVYTDRSQVLGIGYTVSGYGSTILYTWDRVRMVCGLRAEYFSINRTVTFSPRFNSIISITPDLDVTAAFGVHYQQPDFIDLFSTPANNNLSPKSSLLAVAGIEYFWRSLDVTLISEAYYKRFNHVLFPASWLTTDSLDETTTLLDSGRGRSFGLELFMQKQLSTEFFWTFGGSLSRSQFKDPRPAQASQWYPGDYDFGYNMTFTAGWKKDLIRSAWYRTKFHEKKWFRYLSPLMPLGDHMEVAVKWRVLQGRAFTQKVYIPQYRRWYIKPDEPLNNKRMAAYHRLDLRFERRYGFGFVQMIYYFDIINLYARKNVWTYLYPKNFGEKQGVYQLPFFPGGGFIIGF
ncbi:MAG: TonB-dependent receptor [Chitinivibrionales bacterium]|nr:TonB-dependent receptor [Chitinivibrionales bacterium]